MRLFSRVVSTKEVTEEITAAQPEAQPEAQSEAQSEPVMTSASQRSPLVLRRRLEAGKIQPFLSRVSLAFGGLMLVGGVSGANWGLSYVQAELAPRLSLALSQAIDRPIQLGAVEQISLTGIRLGRTVLPSTATDADTITAEALDIRFNPVDAWQHRQLKLTLTLIRPAVYIDQDTAGDWLNLELKFDQAAQIEIEQVRLQDATVTLAPQPLILDDDPPDPNDDPWDVSDRPTQMTLHRVNGFFSLQNQGDRLIFEMAAQPRDRSQLKLSGDLNLNGDRMQVALQTQALQIKDFTAFIPQDLKIDGGILNANLKLQMQADRLPVVSGTADLQEVAGRAKGEPNPFTGINGQFQLQGQEAILSQGRLRFGQIPFQLNGKIHLLQGLDLVAKVPPLDAAPFMQTLQLDVPVPVEGKLASTDLRLSGSFEHPVLSGTAHSVTPIQFDRLTIGKMTGRFRLSLAEDYLQLQEIRLQPDTGGTITAQGEAWLEADDAQIQVAIQDLSADRLAQLYAIQLSDRQLGQFNAQTQITLDDEKPTATANWRLSQGSYPAQGQVVLQNQILRLKDTVAQIGSGKLTAAAELKQGQWQTWLTASQVPMHQFKAGLPGQLQGHLNLQGKAADFSPETMQGEGAAIVQLPQGAVTADLKAGNGRWSAKMVGSAIPLSIAQIAGNIKGQVSLQGRLSQLNLAGTEAEGQLTAMQFLPQPLMANFNWNGKQLQIHQAQTQNASVSGSVTPKLIKNQISGVDAIDLDLNIKDYDLEQLSLIKSVPVAVKGKVNLRSKITGTIDAPQVNGKMQLDRFAIQDFQFEPLSGQISTLAARQLQLDLKGHRDRIALELNHYRPTRFQVQLNQTKAEGQLVGDRLLAKVAGFELERLNLVPDLGLGAVRGKLAAAVEVNLANLAQPELIGTIDVAQPGIGQLTSAHEADRFTGLIRYQQGIAQLQQGLYQLGNSRYSLTAAAKPQTRQWESRIAIEQGHFQDIVTLLPPEQITALIKKFNERAKPTAESVASSQSVESVAASSPSLMLPTLADLTQVAGAFSGRLDLQGNPAAMTAQLDLQGQNWQLANYEIGQISIAAARWQDQTLNLPQVKATGFKLGDTALNGQLNFAGQVSPAQINGQIQVAGVHLPQVQTMLNLPFQLSGQLNAVADLAGSTSQPNLNGELHLDGVTVRNMPIEATKVGFSYIDRQFHLESWQPMAESAQAPLSAN